MTAPEPEQPKGTGIREILMGLNHKRPGLKQHQGQFEPTTAGKIRVKALNLLRAPAFGFPALFPSPFRGAQREAGLDFHPELWGILPL